MQASHAWLQYCWERQSTLDLEQPCLFVLSIWKMQVPDDSLSEWFLGSCFQWATLRAEETPPHRQRAGLLLLSIRAVEPPNLLFLSCNATHYLSSRPSWVLHITSPLWDLRALETDTKQHEALATAFSVNNKVLSLSPKIPMSYARIHEITAG